MANHRLLTLLAAGLVCAAAAAQERAQPAATPASPSAATPATRAAPSEPMRANATAPAEATRANPGAPTDPAAPADPRASSHAIPMGLGSYYGATGGNPTALEAAMGSGTRIPGTRMMRKVCPPGLENRDGNCAPPIDAIMRP